MHTNPCLVYLLAFLAIIVKSSAVERIVNLSGCNESGSRTCSFSPRMLQMITPGIVS